MRTFIWTLLAVVAAPIVVFLVAWFEATVTRTSYVEDAFRWLGLHEAVRRLIQ